jgi:hypothetical protein
MLLLSWLTSAIVTLKSYDHQFFTLLKEKASISQQLHEWMNNDQYYFELPFSGIVLKEVCHP